MPFPLDPKKHAEPSATRPTMLYDEDPSIPASVVLCFQPAVFEYAQEAYEGHRMDPNHPRYRLYTLSEFDDTVGAVGNLGIGGPATARVIEELIARGVETLVIVGHAGGLQQDIAVGDVIVADRALRDDGTSYHYLEPSRTVEATESLTTRLANNARADGETVHVGATWTTDAIFRTTVSGLEQRTEEGVLTVEMEAASVFSVAAYRNVVAGAVFIISDYVGPDEWEGHLTETWPHLKRIFDITVKTLSDDV